jgi:uncharacterized membrane protein
MTRLRAQWEKWRGTYWVVPSAMASAASVLAFVTVDIDRRISAELLGELTWVYTGGPEGARAVLSTVAASMITVAGVTFSITIVALTLASQQFGPRLLRNFLHDVGNQVTLGTFISTYVYCLLVLRTVRNHEDVLFVPHLAVTTGVLLAILSLGVLIFFIHHVATSIQATRVIGNVAADLEGAIARIFPEEIGHGGGVDRSPVPPEVPDFDDAPVVRSKTAGYVQAIEGEGLLKIASQADVVLRIEARPGAFVRAGSVLLSVGSAPAAPSEEFAVRVRETFIIGAERNGTQDVAFFFNQLVELAVRALSPGVNDPATARDCIDRLEAALSSLAGRAMPSPYRYDGSGRLRVVAQPVSFSLMLDVAFTEIARHGRSSASVCCRLLDAVRELAPSLRRESDRQALLRQAMRIGEPAGASGVSEEDRMTLAEHYRAALAAIRTPPLGSR